MPKYTYPLSNGKSLTLEGDMQPTDAEVEEIAAGQGFSLVAADDDEVSPLGEKLSDMRSGIANAMIGGVKGLGKTAIGLGEMVAPALRQIPGVRNLVASPGQFEQARGMMEPQTTGEHIGQAVEQGAEYMIPAGAARRAVGAIAPKVLGKLLPAMAGEATAAAGVASAHGDDPTTAAGLSAAIPVAGKVAMSGAKALHSGAVKLVRAGIKPTVTEMKQTAGASRIGIDNLANRVSEYILKNRITSPEKAQAIIDGAETEIQSLIGGQATDAPARATRYLGALERSAAKQGLGADDVATLRNAAAELVEGPMGHDVVTQSTHMKPSTILNASGQPAAMVPVTTSQTSRALRPSMPADEALTSARASSRWGTRKSWGEQKGSTTEAKKAVERGQRDAVKAAVPATKPVFKEYSQAIKARDIMTRMKFREGNRDVASLPGIVAAAPAVAAGKVPIMGMAVQWLRNNQLKAGIWTDKLGDAIKRNDVQTVTEIMGRLGVSLGADARGNDDMEQELLSRAAR